MRPLFADSGMPLLLPHTSLSALRGLLAAIFLWMSSGAVMHAAVCSLGVCSDCVQGLLARQSLSGTAATGKQSQGHLLCVHVALGGPAYPGRRHCQLVHPAHTCSQPSTWIIAQPPLSSGATARQGCTQSAAVSRVPHCLFLPCRSASPA